MTLESHLDENDFLTHQLFVASKSARIKKKRKRSRLLVALFYFVCAFAMFLIQDYFVCAIFVSIGVLWFLIYPIWERRHYIKHYKGFINENYKDRIGQTGTITFGDEYILAKDSGSESKLQLTELEQIDEIGTLILVRLKGGQSFVLSKAKLNNLNEVVNKLKELAIRLNIEYSIDLNWKWS